MGEKAVDARSTRRQVLKLAGAAAIGAAGMAALGATRAQAAGSGTTVIPYLNPIHIASGHLNANQEVVIGPFPYPNTSFDSQSYLGMIGNLTASRWKGQGWMAVRSTDYAFDAAHQAINLHFGGHTVDAWSNSFVTVFGFGGTASGMSSSGQFVLRNGPAPANYVVDILAFLGPDFIGPVT